MTIKAYRRSDLTWPPSKAQWEALDSEIDAIYRELKKLRTTSDTHVSAHDILSDTHSDALVATTSDGDILVVIAGKWSRLGIGSPGDILQISGGAPAWGSSSPAHNLLSAEHTDTTPASPSKGALIAGSATKWEAFLPGVDGKVLTADSSAANGLAWTDAATSDAVVASVYRSTNQTLTTAVEATISFDTEHFDLSGMWAIGDPTKLVCPTGEDGGYLFNAQITLGTGFQGNAHLRLYKNGTLVAKSTSVGSNEAAGNESHQVAALINLAATDYVQLKVLLELSAGGPTFDVVGGTNTLFFQAAKVAPQAGVVTADDGIQLTGNAIGVKLDGTTLTKSASGLKVTLPAGLVLLEEHTGAASATLDFTTRNCNGLTGATFQSDYDEYFIEFVDILPATNAVNLILRMSTNGGVSYDSAANYAYAIGFTSTAGTGGNTGSGGSTSVLVSGTISNTASKGGTSGFLRLFDPLNASSHKALIGEIAISHSDGNHYSFRDGGWYLSTTAVNAFRVLMDSGNIASGSVRVYGVAK